MRQEAFDSPDDAALAWACIEPTIQQIRGKSPTVKARAYEQLTPGQRSLLMFWILRGHTQNGVAQFYDEVGHLLPQLDVWSALKAALSYFGDETMLRVVEEMERVHWAWPTRSGSERTGWPSPGRPSGTGGSGSDPELLETLDRLSAGLLEALPATVRRIGVYIREHPGEFVELRD
jgi:hypothetical protein